MANRPNKDEYYLKIAEAVAGRGTCARRLVGAVIVKNDTIVSTGYVGAPRGEPNCIDMGVCLRQKHKVPSGTFYELCRSVHAEENAIINAARSGASILGGTLYLFSKPRDANLYPNKQLPSALYLPCYRCKKQIINAGLKEVVILAGDKIIRLTEDDIRKSIKEDEENLPKSLSPLLSKL